MRRAIAETGGRDGSDQWIIVENKKRYEGLLLLPTHRLVLPAFLLTQQTDKRLVQNSIAETIIFIWRAAKFLGPSSSTLAGGPTG